jgi:hypothetical protein
MSLKALDMVGYTANVECCAGRTRRGPVGIILRGPVTHSHWRMRQSWRRRRDGPGEGPSRVDPEQWGDSPGANMQLSRPINHAPVALRPRGCPRVSGSKPGQRVRLEGRLLSGGWAMQSRPPATVDEGTRAGPPRTRRSTHRAAGVRCRRPDTRLTRQWGDRWR